jgi:predicted dehydrogenase
MKQKIRFGLYGCNMYRTRDILAGAHAAAANVVEVAACYDIDSKKADYAAQTYGGKAYRTEAEFLAAPDVDVVIISLPAYLHADAFAHTAKAGKDVYVEKPLCVDQKGRDTVVNAAAAFPVRAYVGLSYRHMAVFRKIAEILRRPDAGSILGVHHHWLAPHIDAMKPEEMGWRHRMEQSGGQLNHHCCHVLDWFQWIGGEIASVTATSYTQPGAPLPHEERELTACFSFEKGGMAVFNLSQDSHQYVQYGTVHTENLGIQYQWGKETFVHVYKTRSRAVDETYEWSLTNQIGDGGELDRNRLQMEEFISAYLEDRPMPIGIADGIRAYDLGCAVRKSYQTGCRVMMPKAAK